MKVVSRVIEINNLLTVQLENNNHELDHIEKNISVHPNIPAPPPPWILNGSPLNSAARTIFSFQRIHRKLI